MPSPVGRAIAIDYEPIRDVARGVTAGYQARGRHEPGAVPDRSARPDGVPDGRVDAEIIRAALAAATTLPRNTFLTVPVGVRVAATDAVRAALCAHGNLAGIVLDVVGPIGSSSDSALEPAIAGYRAAGALIAVGGHGAPQPELASIVRLKPAVLRLGRDWVRGIDTSQARHSAVELICRLADQLDAWVLAQGVSTAGELRALEELQIPLAQGPFIGVPRSRPAGEGV